MRYIATESPNAFFCAISFDITENKTAVENRSATRMMIVNGLIRLPVNSTVGPVTVVTVSSMIVR